MLTPKEIGKRISESRKNKGMTQKDLSEIVGVHPATIKRYEDRFIQNAKMPVIKSIGEALDVHPMWLLGKIEVRSYDEFARKYLDPHNPLLQSDSLSPVERKKIPLLGNIAAGQPIIADEQHDYYVQYGSNINADFCLKVQGDSMINARIYDGDIVFIHAQPEVENGEIAAVAIDDEVTLKRVYVSDNFIELRAENPQYKPMVFDRSNYSSFRILGKAVAFQGEVI